MPAGAAVIQYQGQGGAVYRIKYTDAAGKQVLETLGPERDGWTDKKARVTFKGYAETWFEQEAAKRRWKPKTIQTYRFVRERLLEAFGPMKLDSIRPRHVAGYIAAMSRTHGASSVRRDVDVLHAIFKSALAAELVRHKDRSPYNRDGERVFASRTGGPFRAETYKPAFEKALAKAGIDKQPRPFHDARPRWRPPGPARSP